MKSQRAEVSYSTLSENEYPGTSSLARPVSVCAAVFFLFNNRQTFDRDLT